MTHIPTLYRRHGALAPEDFRIWYEERETDQWVVGHRIWRQTTNRKRPRRSYFLVRRWMTIGRRGGGIVKVLEWESLCAVCRGKFRVTTGPTVGRLEVTCKEHRGLGHQPQGPQRQQMPEPFRRAIEEWKRDIDERKKITLASPSGPR